MGSLFSQTLARCLGQSIWSGYLNTPDNQEVRAIFDAAGAMFAQIDTKPPCLT